MSSLVRKFILSTRQGAEAFLSKGTTALLSLTKNIFPCGLQEEMWTNSLWNSNPCVHPEVPTGTPPPPGQTNWIEKRSGQIFAVPLFCGNF